MKYILNRKTPATPACGPRFSKILFPIHPSEGRYGINIGLSIETYFSKIQEVTNSPLLNAAVADAKNPDASLTSFWINSPLEAATPDVKLLFLKDLLTHELILSRCVIYLSVFLISIITSIILVY